MPEASSRYPNVTPKYRVGSFVFGDPDRRLVSLMGDVRGKTVLDFACGDGPYTAELERRGARVIAADIDTAALQTLQGTVDHSSRVQPVVMDAFKGFPLRDGSVDMVVTTRFPNLFSQGEVIGLMRQANRALVPEGEVVFDFATRVRRIGADGKRIKGSTEVNHGLISGYRTVRTILRDSGFERPKITLTRVNQDLRESAGYTMKNWKLNVRARKKAT